MRVKNLIKFNPGTHCNFLVLFRASGHVERFADNMVKDTKNGECFRADHLIEGTQWNLKKRCHRVQCVIVVYVLAHFEKLLADKKVLEERKTQVRNLLPLVS